MSTLDATTPTSSTTTTTASERVCYVHCTFCNTILAVSVPCSSMYTIVTVRCGHCSNLLSVNMGASSALHHPSLLPPPDLLLQQQKQHLNYEDHPIMECGSSSSSSKCNNFTAYESPETQPPTKMPPIPPPEKRQRIPSAYNRFIKEEIQRIKATNPEISHREAFSTAAKNWAHFPHIHFGLKLEENERAKMDEAFGGGETMPTPHGFY